MRWLLIIAFETSLISFGQDENIHIDLLDANVMYVEYPIKVSISFKDHVEDSIEIYCEVCDEVLKLNKNTWLIQSKVEQQIVLDVINSEGKIIKQASYNVRNIPHPKLYIDSLDATNKIKTIPTKLRLKLDSDIAIKAGFQIINWTIRLDRQLVAGTGNLLSDPAKKLIENTKTGFIVFDIQYIGPFGKRSLKEIFEFHLN